jgi:putative peptidoglycan lipid II flippase
VVIIVIAALGLAVHGLTKQRSADGVTQSGSSQWPQMNLDDVPFGDESSSTTGTENDKSASSDASKTNDKSDTSSTPKKPKASDKITVNTADKNVKAVPTPNLPANTTAFDIDKQEFLTNPGGQRGYAYYMHLSQPQDAYKFIIKIRSSGGTGYLRANATNDPTQGEQVAQFSFDASGTTEVTFTKQVTSQDFLLWVPIDALPNNQLYIDSVQLF